MEKELEKLNQILEAYNKLEKNIDEYKKITSELNSLRGGCSSWRNTKIEYWKDIVNKWGEKSLLNCYGDIFYIVSKERLNGVTTYTGKRVLWNLELSKELYHIEEHVETDVSDEGEQEYIGTNYDIYYWGEEE